MLSALLGRKVGMTQIFGPRGGAIPVTVIEAGPCFVTQVKSAVNDGYEAVQLGFGRAKLKNTTRPILGHLGHKLSLTPNQRRRQQQEAAKNRQKARERAAGAATETEADQAESEGRTGRARARRRATGQELGPFAILREVQVHGGDIPAVGDKVDVGIFAVGERVDLIGTSKGKGFAGVMKRHNFAGGYASHGHSVSHRVPGSIGQRQTPGRVFPGKRMSGHMGVMRRTTENLKIVEVDAARNLLLISGAVPGAKGGQVVVRPSVKAARITRRKSVAPSKAAAPAPAAKKQP